MIHLIAEYLLKIKTRDASNLKHPEFLIFFLIYVLLLPFMLPVSCNPQVRTRG